MPVYIQSAESISPQVTFQTDTFLEERVIPEGNYFSCIHPDYKLFINPSSLRRMSTVIRMGLAASKICLENAGIQQPGAILIGSGLGCVNDTVKFLKQIDENKELLLNPTAFIQSTHNTVSGQIALMLGCKAYNLTFSQKTISFETAMMDALMLLREDSVQTALVGGIDETTEESFDLLVKEGCVKPQLEEDIVSSSTPGAEAGEGASFFVLSNQKNIHSMARIADLEIVNRCQGVSHLKHKLEKFLKRNGLFCEDLDLVVSGNNWDARYSRIYDEILPLFEGSVVAGYKHLVGEYDTASAFGMYLASRIIQSNKVPNAVRMNEKSRERVASGLVFNYGKNQDFTFALLTDPNS